MQIPKLIRIILCVVILTACAEKKDDVYLFSFFQGNGEDGLHLAYSKDGLTWKAINENQSILEPQVGNDQLMRDPCIIKGGDGEFHMVWTVSWNERGIGYAHSKDLIHWSEQQYIPVMEHEPNTRNCWAPELFYDEDSGQYLIYWASTIKGMFPATDSIDNGYNHRMYYCLTKDFKQFSETKVLYDQGFNVIDATIHQIDGEYVMFLKNETKYPTPEKNIRIARSNQLYSNYSDASEPITDNWVEGPTPIQLDSGWVVYYDQYTRHHMGAVFSKDLKEWIEISDQLDFPDGTRHGTIFKVKGSTFNRLITHFSDSK